MSAMDRLVPESRSVSMRRTSEVQASPVTEPGTAIDGMPESTSSRPRRRRRTGKKRVVFQPPQRFPMGVRELWRAASEEERKSAHLASATMLEYWLGRIRKEDAAERLGVPLLRIWQMSQMAVAGMLAGLLKQPRTRRKGAPMAGERDELERLRKENAKLRHEKELAESLVELLRSFPGREEAAAEEAALRKSKGTAPRARGVKKTNARRASKKIRRAAPGDRGVDRVPETPEG